MFGLEISPFLLFIIAGLILIASELLIGIEAGFDLVLLGTILIISGITGNFTGDLTSSIITAAVLSVVYIAFGRQIVKRKLTVKTQKTNIDNMIGKIGTVLTKISPDSAGQIKLDSEKWRASADQTINPDEKVKVVSIEGVTMHVEKA